MHGTSMTSAAQRGTRTRCHEREGSALVCRGEPRYRSDLFELRMRSCVFVCLALAGCTQVVPPSGSWPDRRVPVGGTGLLAFVTNNGSDSLSVIEVASLTEIARRPVGRSPVDPEQPHHLALDPDRGEVWVGLSDV